jgi:hypothetical protein
VALNRQHRATPCFIEISTEAASSVAEILRMHGRTLAAQCQVSQVVL